MFNLGRHRVRNFRCYSTSIPSLPPRDKWNELFGKFERARRHRISLCNPTTAKTTVKALFNKKAVKRPKTIIEAYPGPGVLTRALLELPPDIIGKIIVVEDVTLYSQKLKELAAYDSRVTVIDSNAISWDAYNLMESEGLLGKQRNWSDKPDLEFICQLPNTVHGEQFLSQMLRAIPHKTWLFKYGRIPLHLFMVESLFDKMRARPQELKRGKLSVIAEATADIQCTLPFPVLQPYDKHFWPSTYGGSPTPAARKPGKPMVLATVKPKETQRILPNMADKWDFVLRHLFVLKTTELRKALPSMAPGAKALIPYLSGPDVPIEDQVDITTPIRNLTIQDWENIVKAFDRWPFAPKDLGAYDGERLEAD
ncbi:hypothetical protein M422DRAFT_246523 [Sphaerobolus stellatus SS14]|nr:hypothetical protein M422DRAFT_246523 [Sphaerobolus stellatus SS14]